jgi:hypothetical protein
LKSAIYVFEMRGARQPRRALLCLAAAACCIGLADPQSALADDGALPMDGLPTSAAATDALDAALSGDTGDVVDAVETAVETTIETAVQPAVEPAVEAAAPTQAPTSPPTQTIPSVVPAEPAQEEGPLAADPVDVASTNGSGADTTDEPADTTRDSTGSAGAAPPAPAGPAPTAPATVRPAATPTAALNVNVDVRIDSSGDNGAVTQLNAAAPAPTSTTSVTPRAEPPATGTAATAGPSPADTGESSWYWQWDCLSAPEVPVVSPAGSGGGSIPASWTWIWNCAGNEGQYQDQSAGQYQQINANISVRISSPGNNGPVTQTNIAISTGTGSTAGVSRPPSSTPSTSVGSQVTIGVTLPAIAIALPTLEAAFLEPVAATPAVEETIAAVTGDVEVELDAALRLVTASLGAGGALEPIDLRRAPFRRSQVAATVGGLAFGPTAGGIAVIPTPTAVAAAAGRASFEAGRATRDARATRHVPGAPDEPSPAPRAPMTAPTGATASAAGAGGSSGGGIPIFLALPFVAAMLDLARRVALDRAAWPSGHRRRVPERPG